MAATSTLLEREEPQTRLGNALECARRGQGGLVAVEGEAGIGKTALVLNFADAHARDARVYIGGCEHLATPQPLLPLVDIARHSQGRFSISATGQLATFDALLRLLTGGRGPALLLIEDIHWADDASLDLIRFLARRVGKLPVLIIVTFRSDEAALDSRLTSLWADLPRDVCEHVVLLPLSPEAVSHMSVASGRSAREVYAATGGNPFFVTEYLATAGDDVPTTVRNATLQRAARLGSRARRALDGAAIFPRQIDEELLHEFTEDVDHAGVEECLHAGMLIADHGALHFRHELARRAVLDAMSPLHRRELHRTALKIIKARRQVNSAQAAHHAEHAGAFTDLVHYSRAAAEEAATMGAHREVIAHAAAALAHGTDLTMSERADLLERQAQAGERCGAFDLALPAIEQAVQLRGAAGDELGRGNALRIQARLTWQQGQVELAESLLRSALAALEPHAHTWQYALALSSQSQLDMLATRVPEAIERGTAAMARAQALERWDIYLHAWTNVAAARSWVDPKPAIEDLGRVADACRRHGELEALPRLYACLCFSLAHERCYDQVFERCREGVDASTARDNVPMKSYVRGCLAIALLDSGRATEALAEAEQALAAKGLKGTPLFPALYAASRARVRLGADEGGVIDVARKSQTSQRDVMRMAPIAVADAEALWLGVDRPGTRDRLASAFNLLLRSSLQCWALTETALWLKILGEPVEIPEPVLARLAPALQLHLAEQWTLAAAAWRAMGCPYEQAIALAAGDEASQREALEIFDELGAAPAAQKLRREMRARGIRSIPSGTRAARRDDPAGLTTRQSQVLRLLALGLSNAQIGTRLGVSAKTAEHHVCAVLTALDAQNRTRAVQIARERGLLGHEGA